MKRLFAKNFQYASNFELFVYFKEWQEFRRWTSKRPWDCSVPLSSISVCIRRFPVPNLCQSASGPLLELYVTITKPPVRLPLDSGKVKPAAILISTFGYKLIAILNRRKSDVLNELCYFQRSAHSGHANGNVGDGLILNNVPFQGFPMGASSSHYPQTSSSTTG